MLNFHQFGRVVDMPPISRFPNPGSYLPSAFSGSWRQPVCFTETRATWWKRSLVLACVPWRTKSFRAAVFHSAWADFHHNFVLQTYWLQSNAVNPMSSQVKTLKTVPVFQRLQTPICEVSWGHVAYEIPTELFSPFASCAQRSKIRNYQTYQTVPKFYRCETGANAILWMTSST